MFMTAANSRPILLPSDAISMLAERVRSARILAKLTQNELAERSGLTAVTVQKIEGGKNVTLETFLKVLLALGHLEDTQHLLVLPEVSSLEELRRREAQRERSAKLPKRVRK